MAGAVLIVVLVTTGCNTAPALLSGKITSEYQQQTTLRNKTRCEVRICIERIGGNMAGFQGPGSIGNMTITQLFNKIGLIPWWQHPTNPYNGTTEKGIDFSIGYGKPVGAIAPGNVVYAIHHNNSINDEIGIYGPSGLYHYQHINSNLRVGDSVMTGQTVGTQNGLPVDQFSTGSHIEVRYAQGYNKNGDTWTGQQWINPANQFGVVANSTASNVPQSPATMVPANQCQALDIGCYLTSFWNNTVSSALTNFGEAIAIFIIAIVMVVFGLVLMGAKPIEKVGKAAAKAGLVAA